MELLKRNSTFNLYSYTNYKDVVRDILKDDSGRVPRGGYKELAVQLRCNPSFISHFFKKDIHFTIDHAFRFWEIFNFSREETLYFMELIHMQKAGDYRTKEFFSSIVEETKNLKTEATAAAAVIMPEVAALA